ncbi:DUF4412 domain-containing protein [Aequorivita marisscotiae]|uniref:DUF4412 domain-containing protein n=1 Tax=Aequorivita marisscotiae TaxID=3040348 RepID=A0ABY8KSE3_9FLAO|nr:DUF4412 domain-containing protein [Aequorivita sp. Ant34-E75]WGF92371.1 DUF4412 domain-containing protein [Aequorivita sp. Ant34-E75]
MKTKHLLILLAIFFLGTTAQAQFLKKLKKTAENAVERTVLNKTDREVSKSTDKTIDGVIQGGDEKKSNDEEANSDELTEEEKAKVEQRAMNIFGGGMEGIPDAYTFQYMIDMKITSNKDQSTLKYYVQPNAGYFGNAMPEEKNKNVIVYDLENQAMVMFMDNDGQKTAMKMRMPLGEKMQEMIEKGQSGEENNVDNINITPIAGKTILGYKCKGYLVKQEEGTSKIYITNEAPVSFVGMFASMEKMQKDNNAPTIPFDKNSMMMEVEYTSNKRKRDNMHMICTSIKEQPFTIRKADYSGM